MDRESKTYLFQVSIPSVQKFISSSRKTSDLWASSFMISYIMKKLLNEALKNKYTNLIYPRESESNEIDGKIYKKFDTKGTIANVPNIAIFTIDGIGEAEESKNTLRSKSEILLEDIVDKVLEKFFSENIEVEHVKKTYKTNTDYEVQKILNERKDIINDNKNLYKELARYQIKNVLKILIEFVELKDYKKSLENLARILSYEKKSQLPDINYFENYSLMKSHENWDNLGSWTNFYEDGLKQEIIKNKDNRKRVANLGLIHGVYRCSSCGEHTIIGATLEDWRGNLIWKTLWEANPKYFKRGERLCGVCLAKRYFRDYLKEKENIDESELGFPSTSEIGATLFKKTIIEVVKYENMTQHNKFLGDLVKFQDLEIRGNYVKKINSVLDSIDNIEKKNLLIGILNKDGEWFLEDTWKNPNDYEPAGINSVKAYKMLESLKSIYDYIGKNKKIEKHHKPSKYYAMIMLDGDNIGEKLSLIKSPEEHQEFSQELSKLSKEFKNIVEKHYGALIYSGGDDVLALTPVEKAFDCAYEIQNRFKEFLKNKFSEIDQKSLFSMSGSIVYAYHKLPLSLILDEARKGEEKAKHEGKDRVCIKYIKSSLSSAEAVFEWDRVRNIYFSYIKDLNIPNSLPYSIDKIKNILSLRGDYQKLVLNFKLKENLLKSLLKNKLEKNLVDKYLGAFREIDSNYDFLKIINSLKIFSFINLKGDHESE